MASFARSLFVLVPLLLVACVSTHQVRTGPDTSVDQATFATLSLASDWERRNSTTEDADVFYSARLDAVLKIKVVQARGLYIPPHLDFRASLDRMRHFHRVHGWWLLARTDRMVVVRKGGLTQANAVLEPGRVCPVRSDTDRCIMSVSVLSPNATFPHALAVLERTVARFEPL